MPTRTKPSPKRVVYLWGAGATQAEAQYLGAAISLLMRDNKQFGEGIASRILRRMGDDLSSSFYPGHDVDIEKLISLFSASGINKHSRWANRMRSTYFSELCASLSKANVLDIPRLAIELFQMHNDQNFKEEVETLSGIITTNHDGLLQIASQTVFGKLNLGFKFCSHVFTVGNSNSVPAILQLHGSLTWRFGVPIKVAKLHEDSRIINPVWIPPTILKESKTYPFNKLTGLAYELLAKRCDLLRVVGASLTQNDWNVLSMIFNAQRHREYARGSAFPIELIMPHNDGEMIKYGCSYLKNMMSIGYLTDGRFSEYEERFDQQEEIPADSDLANPFAYWLREKKSYHRIHNGPDAFDVGREVDEPLGEDS